MSLQALQPLSSPSHEVGTARLTLTVSQLTQYFAAWLAKPGNYPRIARRYLEYCLTEGFSVDGVSFRLYTAGKEGNLVSPLKKFLFFYQTQGCPRVLADPPRGNQTSPAANELILGYLTEATHLRGDHTRESYTKALNAFFAYLAAEQQQGRSAPFSGLTVGRYVQALRERGLSAFTINFYLSTVKQLSAWVITARERLDLTPEQVDALRDVDGVKGLVIERRFYKESLECGERDALLSSIESAEDRAILALLVVEGLRTVEVTRLTWGDVDLPRGLLSVMGKGKHTKKDIVLFKPCAQALSAYLHELGYTTSKGGDKIPLFPELKTHQIRYKVDKYLKKGGLKRPRVSAHSLRHTTGQLLLAEGVEPMYVQRHLRHELFETTQFYIRKKTEDAYFDQVRDRTS
jgi:integrase/recombinase XerD